MENRTYLVQDAHSFVMMAQIINTHYQATCQHENAKDVTLSIAFPGPVSAAVMDSIVDAVTKHNSHYRITRIERGQSYVKVEKESTFGTPVKPQRRWSPQPLDIQPTPMPVDLPSMTDQIARIWPNLEPLDQRMCLAELLHNTPMTRAEVQAVIASLIERLVIETVKERA